MYSILARSLELDGRLPVPARQRPG